MKLISFLASVLLCSGHTFASPILIPRAPSDYAPVQTTCPAIQLVRSADGLSAAEANYISNRYAKASQSLRTWLQSVDPSFECNSTHWGGPGAFHHRAATNSSIGKPPVIALTTSGGGYRSMLTGGGVIKALDNRENTTSGLSGLYQSLTYEAGLSGGAWLLSSIAGNDYPTISSLQSNLWEPGLELNVLVPQILLSTQAASVYSSVRAAIAAKQAAGFAASIIDPWGRLLSYSLLYGPDGGIQKTISDIASSSNFTSQNAPYPIMTALGVDTAAGECIPPANATQYEFSPYEFGSWDTGVHAFVNSEFLGTPFSNGQPTSSCVTNYDNLGFILGTSSDIFNVACGPIPAGNSTGTDSLALVSNLAELVAPGAPGLPESAIFALYPNPFANFEPSTLVADLPALDLVDGGVSELSQVNPIWPFLNRDVDVIIVNDNSADTVDNFPNGTEILNTYIAATAAGLTRMPVIPPVSVFIDEKLNQRPTFFGCNNPDTATIIWIPNYNYTYPSGEPTLKIQYFTAETQGMVSNGEAVATRNGDGGFPLCMACAITKKTGEQLPVGCDDCFAEYCYN